MKHRADSANFRLSEIKVLVPSLESEQGVGFAMLSDQPRTFHEAKV